MNTGVKELRNKTGLSQIKFSIFLGVSVASLRRWESGDANPSPMAQKRLFEAMALSDEELLEQSIHIEMPREQISDEAYITCFNWKGRKYEAVWAPYVINGPKDQFGFYVSLLKMQQNAALELSEKQYFERLSLLRSVNGIETSQYKMEKAKHSAKSWSSDYGTHGFHRYVGRFPSHLIRALINAFSTTKDDLILDPFCGSGTTLVEARMLGVPAVGIEISPLSAMISRVKSQFPSEGLPVKTIISDLVAFYQEKWDTFVQGRTVNDISYDAILDRRGNELKRFPNIERWFSKDALLGTSITLEYIQKHKGYYKDFLTIALSAKMRSIGNVDVDVVRAEYRKTPRQNVDVLKLVIKQIQKMSSGIAEVVAACQNTLGRVDSVDVIEGSVLNASIPEKSIASIITSPPYGVESLSYLRTHLLSFRVLESVLGVDPYSFGDGVIGSEYLDNAIPDIATFHVNSVSSTYASYFDTILGETEKPLEKKRVIMMMKFFEDMYCVIRKFSIWIKDNGNVAFIIGNKKIGDSVIPTDRIIIEIFCYFGFELRDSIQHKLKTNNSNSQVPWQDRIIENEYTLLFQKVRK